MKANSILLFFIIVLSACANSSKSEFESITKQLSQSNKILESKIIILIPQNGCGYCIEQANRFINKHIDTNKDLCCIILGYRNLKEIKANYRDLIAFNNFILDSNDVYIKNEYSSINPVVVFNDFENHQYITKTIKPKQSKAFYIELEKYIKNECNLQEIISL